METRSRKIGCSWSLPAIVLFALLHWLPTTSGINCYCSNHPAKGFPLCHWEGYTCSGDMCYVRRFVRVDGVIATVWGCLHHHDDHIDLVCDEGAFNQATEQYRCCNDRTNCNEHVEIVLPIELPPTTTSSEPTVAITTVEEQSSGSGGDGAIDVLPSTDPMTTRAVSGFPVPTSAILALSSELLPRASITPQTSLPTAPVSSSPLLLPISTPPPISSDPLLLCSCSNCPSGVAKCTLGGSCFVRVDFDLEREDNGLDPRPLSWGCMNASESTAKCQGRSDQYKCCSSGDFCNEQLLVAVTEEPTAVTTSAGCSSDSGDCQTSKPLDQLQILPAVVVVVVTVIVILLLLVLLAVLLVHIRRLHVKKSPVSTEGSSRSDSCINSVSTELDSVNGGSPTSKSSPHHLLHIQVVPSISSEKGEHVFGDSDNCST